MRDPHLEELISAYLDGELTSDERLLVERRLSESAEDRQLFEQLRQQQALLRSLPRRDAPSELAARIVRRLGDAKSTPATTEEPILATLASPNVPATKPRSSTWKAMVGVFTTLAAGLLIAVVLRHGGTNDSPVPPPVIPVGPVNPPLPLDQFATVDDFQQRFKLLLVFDIAVTPKGQDARVLEESLNRAGIPLAESVAIENRLEKDLLASRFIGGDRITTDGSVRDVSKDRDDSRDNVEMVFIRAKMNQIDALHRDLWRLRQDQPDLVHVRMDLAMATKELEIFLNLNNAVGGENQTRLAQVESWSKVGAHRLRFPMSLHSVSLTRLGAFAVPAKQPEVVSPRGPTKTGLPGIPSDADSAKVNSTPAADAEAKKKASVVSPLSMDVRDPGMDPDQPSQSLLIIRNLKPGI